MVHLHVVGLGDVDDAELVAEKPRDMHLRVRGRGDGNAVLAADLARLHVAGVAAAQQHDRVVLAAGAGLAHQRQAVVADRHEFLLGGDRPVAVGREGAGMEIPVDVGEEGLYVLVVIDLRLLGAGKRAQLEVVARRQAEGVDQQEAVFARLGGHDGLPFMRLRASLQAAASLSMLWHLT